MASTFGTSGSWGAGSMQAAMRFRRLQNVAAGTSAQLETKFDKAGGEITGDVSIRGNISADNLPPPGVFWETAEPPDFIENNNRWYGIAWSDSLGLFAAVAYSGNNVMTSPDGYNWTRVAVPASCFSICWSSTQRKFVGGGENKTIISSDGVTWTEHSFGTGTLQGISWIEALGKYVGTGANAIFLSADGITFDKIDLSTLTPSVIYYRVAYSAELNRLVAVGNNNLNTPTSGRIIYSDDGGLTWAIAASAGTRTWRGIAYSGRHRKFVAVAQKQTDFRRVASSTDGENWVIHADCGGGDDKSWRDVLYIDKHDFWVAVGPAGIESHVMTSRDGRSWARGFVSGAGAQNAVTYSPELDRLVGVGDGYGYPWIMVSPRFL